MSQNERRPRKGAATDTAKDNPFLRLGGQRRAALRAPTADWCRGVEVVPTDDRAMKLMLHVIARSCGEDGTTTFLGRAHLALAVGVSEDHITRLKHKAKKVGLLTWKARSSQRKRLYDRYVLQVVPVTPEEFDAVVQRRAAGESQNDIWRSLCARRHEGAHNPTSDVPQPDISASRKTTSRGRVNHHKSHLLDHQSNHRAPAGARGKGDGEGRPRRYATADAAKPTANGNGEHHTPHPGNPTSGGRIVQPDMAGGRDDPPVHESQMDYLRRMGYAK
jgi:hypothetical protein